MAKHSAMVMPRVPPKAWPMKSNNSVKAVSKNAVLSVFMAFVPGARSGRARLCLLVLELHFAGLRIGVDDDRVARLHLAVEDFQRQRILNQPLNCALHRTSAVRRLVSFTEEQRFRRGGQSENDLLFRHSLHERTHLQVNNTLDLVLAERAEHDDVVDAVQKLGTESFPQCGHGLLARLLRILSSELENRRRTDVR